MSELIFTESNHQYTLAGEVLVSVTQVLSPLYDFSAIDPEVLANKARFGSQIHKMCALFCWGDLDEISLSEVQIKYLEQFSKFRREWPLDFSKSQFEVPMASAKLKYAGTPDIFIASDCVIDIKTRKFNKVTDPIQLAAYDMLITENFTIKGVCRDLWVLELSEDSYKFQRAMPNRDKKEYQNRFLYLLKHHKDEIEFQKNINLWKGNK